MAGRRPALAAARAALGLALAALCTAGAIGDAALAAAVVAAAPAAPSATPAAELASLEATQRARPAAAVAALEPLLSKLGAEAALAAELQLLRGLLQVKLGEPAAVEQTARWLDMAAADSGNPAAAACASLLRAQAMARDGPLGRADRLMAEAGARLPADSSVSLRVRFLQAHAKVKDLSGKLDDAVRLAQQALQLADPVLPAWRRAELRNALAYSYFQAQQLERAQKISAEAVALAQGSGDALAVATAMATRGIVLSGLDRPQDELQAMQTAIEYARLAGSRHEEVRGLANLADYYLKHDDPATALRLSRQALPLAREVRDLSSESVALANAGLALIAMGQRAEGLALARQSLAIDERTGSLTGLSSTQMELGMVLEKAGFLKDAWLANVEHRRLADEVFRREHQQAILELQEGFDHAQRQRELTLLDREHQLQAAAFTGNTLRQRLWVLGTVVALLLVGVVAALAWRMRHTNARLATTNAQLKVQSERDPLTGLANRRHFQAEMRRVAADGMLEGSVLLIDADHFKHINDRHGHGAGDAVLVAIADRLRATLREQDLTVRWGGEEFLVVVRALPPAEVEALAERLLRAIGGTPVAVGSTQIAVTVSIGFATFPIEPARRPMSWERAIDLVDTALYLAKAHGRNRAYGVRMLHADDDNRVPGAASTLESAWRDGRVALAQLSGPVPAVCAVAAVHAEAAAAVPADEAAA